MVLNPTRSFPGRSQGDVKGQLGAGGGAGGTGFAARSVQEPRVATGS